MDLRSISEYARPLIGKAGSADGLRIRARSRGILNLRG
jgi:hypothetical protein